MNTEQREQPLEERIDEEIVSLGLMSTHGTASGIWFADLTEEDVKSIAGLLADCRARLSAVEQDNELLRAGNEGLIASLDRTATERDTARLAIDELTAGVLAAEARVEAAEVVEANLKAMLAPPAAHGREDASEVLRDFEKLPLTRITLETVEMEREPLRAWRERARAVLAPSQQDAQNG